MTTIEKVGKRKIGERTLETEQHQLEKKKRKESHSLEQRLRDEQEDLSKVERTPPQGVVTKTRKSRKQIRELPTVWAKSAGELQREETTEEPSRTQAGGQQKGSTRATRVAVQLHIMLLLYLIVDFPI